MPVVVKDNLDYAGLVTTAGFDGFSAATGGVDMVPGDDAVAVERLQGAGAVILGKTNMPDFAAHGTRTRSSVAGETLNPYALDRVPGGSSGGTATAVNASFAVLGLGTETGGSIQNPAAAQALVGIKPTFGLVPLEGVVPSDATYRDVVGPLARTVRDAAIALDVIAGPSPKDLASYAGAEHVPESGYEGALSATALRGKRFGLVGPGWRESFLPLAPETEALYARAVQVLEAEGGAVVEDPFAGRGWVAMYSDRPGVPTVGSHDLAVYLQGLGPEAAFNSVEEWEALSGRSFRGGRRRRASDPAERHRGGRRLPGVAARNARALPDRAGRPRAGRAVLPPGGRADPAAGRGSRTPGVSFPTTTPSCRATSSTTWGCPRWPFRLRTTKTGRPSCWRSSATSGPMRS